MVCCVYMSGAGGADGRDQGFSPQGEEGAHAVAVFGWQVTETMRDS